MSHPIFESSKPSIEYGTLEVLDTWVLQNEWKKSKFFLIISLEEIKDKVWVNDPYERNIITKFVPCFIQNFFI